MPLINN